MSETVRRHYEQYPYPRYPLIASVRPCDGYAISLTALWAAFNGELPPAGLRRILVAGCGSFAPYPFSVANPDCDITSLDLSDRSLRRARLHCLLHGRRNVRFCAGDLLEPKLAEGPFGMIDAYGVIHHLKEPVTGLKSLAERLAAGGIMRVMVYSRYARREEESIRRALRMMAVETVGGVRALAGRAADSSRLHRYLSSSSEAAFEAGLADALLHPCVHTFRIDALLEMISRSGLELLRFAHDGARESVAEEIERIRQLERERTSPGNFLFSLGRSVKGGGGDLSDASLMLNPCLAGAVRGLHLHPVRIAPRLGVANQPLGLRERRFLGGFRRPVPYASLDAASRAMALDYLKTLFLIPLRKNL